MSNKYRLRAESRRSFTWKPTLIIVLVLVLIVGGVYILFNPVKTPQQPTSKAPAPVKPQSIQLESKLLFMGDTYWGRYMHEWSQASPIKNAYPFSGLSSFQRDNYDAWIANLECPTVPGKTITPKAEDATLMFNCNPDYLDEAKKWFTAFSLANNHTDNQGTAGFEVTKTQLDQRGIKYFGHYDPEKHEQLCRVIAVDTNTSEKLPLALCGYHGVFKIPSDASLAVIKEYAAYMPVITMPHMGVEYKTGSDAIRETVYRKMIDNGADAVIAAHPHWVQNTEVYNGKPIFYSIGNFIFDQQANQEVSRSAPVALTMTTDKADPKDMQAWSELLKTCAPIQSCIADAKGKNLPQLPTTLTYDIVPGDSSGKLTKKASPDVAAGVLERLNWEQTKQQLTAQ